MVKARSFIVEFGCVARYYFLATFEARRWRSSPSVGRLMVFQDFLAFLPLLSPPVRGRASFLLLAAVVIV